MPLILLKAFETSATWDKNQKCGVRYVLPVIFADIISGGFCVSTKPWYIQNIISGIPQRYVDLYMVLWYCPDNQPDYLVGLSHRNEVTVDSIQ